MIQYLILTNKTSNIIAYPQKIKPQISSLKKYIYIINQFFIKSNKNYEDYKKLYYTNNINNKPDPNIVPPLIL